MRFFSPDYGGHNAHSGARSQAKFLEMLIQIWRVFAGSNLRGLWSRWSWNLTWEEFSCSWSGLTHFPSVCHLFFFFVTLILSHLELIKAQLRPCVPNFLTKKLNLDLKKKKLSSHAIPDYLCPDAYILFWLSSVPYTSLDSCQPGATFILRHSLELSCQPFPTPSASHKVIWAY